MVIVKNTRTTLLALWLLSTASIAAAFDTTPLHNDLADYLQLQWEAGEAERPYLSLATAGIYHDALIRGDTGLWGLPDSQMINLGGSELVALPTVSFTSFNSTYPSGINDGLLWQGRGLNQYLSGGVRWSTGSWLQVTIAPEFAFSQNLGFELVESRYTAYEYGYITQSIDLPQRFGNDPVFHPSFGQSELRVTYRRLTAGVGTQNLRIGPARENPLLMSATAGGFPHLDFGLLPVSGSFGDFEARLIYGHLSESDYFDADPDTDDRYLALFTLAYRPPFYQALTLGATRTVQRYAKGAEASFLLSPFDPRSGGGTTDGRPSYGQDDKDQRISLTAELTYPSAGLTVYGEFAKNDYTSGTTELLQIPGHSRAYTLGLSQQFSLPGDARLRLSLEHSNLFLSRSYYLAGWFGPGSFYNHGIVSQGYTHEGQLLGAGIGPGADAQYLGLDYYDEWGRVGLFLRRINKDAEYVYAEIPNGDRGALNVELVGGLSAAYVSDPWIISAGLALGVNVGRNYVPLATERNLSAFLSLTLK